VRYVTCYYKEMMMMMMMMMMMSCLTCFAFMIKYTHFERELLLPTRDV